MKTILTKDCFKGSNIYYRDSDIDSWLPKKQNVVKVSKPTPCDYATPLTFLEMAQKFYGTTDVKELLKKTFSLTEIEAYTKDPEKYGLKTDGWGNLFFVEEKNGGVSVVGIGRGDDGRWSVHVGGLDRVDRWSLEHRFFSRNLDSRTLGNSDTSDIEKRVSDLEKYVDRLRDVFSNITE